MLIPFKPACSWSARAPAQGILCTAKRIADTSRTAGAAFLYSLAIKQANGKPSSQRASQHNSKGCLEQS